MLDYYHKHVRTVVYAAACHMLLHDVHDHSVWHNTMTPPQVVCHMMPDLPNVGWERDLECFREFFENPAFRADGLKLYPTLVIRGGCCFVVLGHLCSVPLILMLMLCLISVVGLVRGGPACACSQADATVHVMECSAGEACKSATLVQVL